MAQTLPNLALQTKQNKKTFYNYGAFRLSSVDCPAMRQTNNDNKIEL